MKRMDLDNHLKKYCLENKIECKKCKNKDIKRKDMQDHLQNICPESIIDCEDCGEEFKRKLMN